MKDLNICNKGFDKIDKVKNHVFIYQKDTQMLITKNIEEEEDSISDESFGDSWLAKFDEDGKRLG